MTYSAAALKNEYSDASVDDILAEYQVEQRSAAAQARYEEIMQAEPEETNADVSIDEEGVKVYKPKKSASLSNNSVTPSPEQENAEEYIPQSEHEYYDGQTDFAYYDEQDDSAYYDEQDNSAYYDGQDNSAYYDGQDNSAYYDGQDDSAYYDGQDDSAYYDGQDDSAYHDRQEYPDAENVSAFLTAEDLESSSEYEDKIDPRFNLSGKRKSAMFYGGKELDISPEENYIPPTSRYSLPVQEDNDIYEEEQPQEEKPKKKFRFGFGKSKKAAVNAPPEDDYSEEPDEDEDDGRPYVQQYSDMEEASDTTAEYAEKADYSQADDLEPDEEDFNIPESFLPHDESYARPGRSVAAKHKDADDFPSFGQFILEYLTGILYKFKSAGESDGSTMEDNDEDLGREVTPMKASKYYGSYVHSMRLRLRISAAILVIMAYISLGLPMTGMLKTLPVQAAVLLGCQLCIMVLCLDVLTGAVINVFTGRFGADSLAVCICILTSFDALSVTVGAFGDPHTPFCLLSSLSMAGVLFASLLSARGIRKALRVPAIGKTVYAVTGESGVKGNGMTLLKSVRSSSGFVRRTEEAAPDETIFTKLSPILLEVCVLLALIVAAVQKSWSNYLFILTALLAPAVPVTALLCFALPFFVGSMRIFSSGASIAGWSGLCDVGASKNLVVTDRDLFPQGSVEIENILILDELPSDKVISYAGTMLSASGSGIASCFVKLMEKNGCTMKKVQNFEYMAGGGLKAIIDGDTVLCGGVEFMRLMNVHVPYRQIKKTPVLLAVNGMLYGIFNMKYTAQPQVRKALISLIRSNRHPIFAVRDFNVNPEMLRESFDVATDGYDFPPYVERYSISEAKPGNRSKISAVVCREGLGPLTHMADTGRSMYVATRINILISVISAVIGIMAVFIKFLNIGAASPNFMLVYMLIWMLPVAALSYILKF